MMNAANNAGSRAGRYVAQPTGYRAFMPTNLPPAPPVLLDGELQRLLSEADRALGRLDGSIHTLPNPDLFVYMYVRKEAVLSSQIEGTQSSLQDLLSAEANAIAQERAARLAVRCAALHPPRGAAARRARRGDRPLDAGGRGTDEADRKSVV